MSQLFNRLESMGYSGCFYQGGEIWGFHDIDVMPKPIARDIIRAAESESTRDRLSERLKSWCDRRGIHVLR